MHLSDHPMLICWVFAPAMGILMMILARWDALVLSWHPLGPKRTALAGSAGFLAIIVFALQIVVVGQITSSALRKPYMHYMVLVESPCVIFVLLYTGIRESKRATERQVPRGADLKH